MSDRDLCDAVARKAGEDSHEIALHGSILSSLDGPPVHDPRHAGGLGQGQIGAPSESWLAEF